MKKIKFATALFILIVLSFNNPLFTQTFYFEDIVQAKESIPSEQLDTGSNNFETTQDTASQTEENKQDTELLKTEDIKETIPQQQLPETIKENTKPSTIERPNEELKEEIKKESIKEKINPNNYTEKISYTGFSDLEIQFINDVLRIYEENKNCGQEFFEEKIDYIPTYQNYQNVNSFFHIYYGIQDGLRDVVFDLRNYGGEYATINIYVNNMNKFNAERNKNTKKILEVISSFNEGTEKEKIDQIAKYIAKQTSYVDNNYDVSDLLFSGKSVCNSYALTMIRFCQLLGIKNDICIGYSPSGKHAWNKVTYSDGTVEYFDLTLYDTNNNYNSKYLHMQQTHYPIESINLYY